jgi:hypothetical protein
VAAPRRTGFRALGWARFCGWALAGFLLTSLVSQVAIVLVPVGVLTVCVMVGQTRERRELLGVVAGLGCAVALIGAIHVDDGGCATHRDARTTRVSCGGFDGKPWLAVGLMLTAAAALAYEHIGRRSGSERRPLG